MKPLMLKAESSLLSRKRTPPPAGISPEKAIELLAPCRVVTTFIRWIECWTMRNWRRLRLIRPTPKLMFDNFTKRAMNMPNR